MADHWHEDAKQNGVAVALVVCPGTGRWLMERRSRNVRYPGTWGLPGGALEPGETFPEAANRELAEEAGIHNARYRAQFPLAEDEFKGVAVVFIVDKELKPRRSKEADVVTWVDEFPDNLIPVMHADLAKYKAAIEDAKLPHDRARSLSPFSPAFRSWFGRSVVVDETGKPMRMYHGTASDINEFKREYLGKGHDQQGSGFYFTSDPENASTYAVPKPEIADTGAGPNIVPVYLRILKPVGNRPLTPAQIHAIIDAGDPDSLYNFGDVDFDGRAKVIRDAVLAYTHYEHDVKKALFALSNDFYDGNEGKFLEIVTKVTGYDGIVVHHGGVSHAVVFSPSQIKSIYNPKPRLGRSEINAAAEPTQTNDDPEETSEQSVKQLQAKIKAAPVTGDVNGVRVRVEAQDGAIALLLGPTEVRFWLVSTPWGGAQLVVGDIGRYATRTYFEAMIDNDKAKTPSTLLKEAIRVSLSALPKLTPAARGLMSRKRVQAAAEPGGAARAWMQFTKALEKDVELKLVDGDRAYFIEAFTPIASEDDPDRRHVCVVVTKPAISHGKLQPAVEGEFKFLAGNISFREYNTKEKHIQVVLPAAGPKTALVHMLRQAHVLPQTIRAVAAAEPKTKDAGETRLSAYIRDLAERRGVDSDTQLDLVFAGHKAKALFYDVTDTSVMFTLSVEAGQAHNIFDFHCKSSGPGKITIELAPESDGAAAVQIQQLGSHAHRNVSIRNRSRFTVTVVDGPKTVIKAAASTALKLIQTLHPGQATAAADDQDVQHHRTHAMNLSEDRIFRFPLAYSLVKHHPSYRAAKSGDDDAALDLIEYCWSSEIGVELQHRYHGCTFVAPHAVEASGRNVIPQVLAAVCARACRGKFDKVIVQMNKVGHTGAGREHRMVTRAVFSGVVAPGKYVLVDDNITSGATLYDLGSYVTKHGGTVVGIVALTSSRNYVRLQQVPKRLLEVQERFGKEKLDVLLRDHGLTADALTAPEVEFLSRFRDADAVRDRLAATTQAVGLRQGPAEDRGNAAARPGAGSDSEHAEGSVADACGAAQALPGIEHADATGDRSASSAQSGSRPSSRVLLHSVHEGAAGPARAGSGEGAVTAAAEPAHPFEELRKLVLTAPKNITGKHDLVARAKGIRASVTASSDPNMTTDRVGVIFHWDRDPNLFLSAELGRDGNLRPVHAEGMPKPAATKLRLRALAVPKTIVGALIAFAAAAAGPADVTAAAEPGDAITRIRDGRQYVLSLSKNKREWTVEAWGFTFHLENLVDRVNETENVLDVQIRITCGTLLHTVSLMWFKDKDEISVGGMPLGGTTNGLPTSKFQLTPWLDQACKSMLIKAKQQLEGNVRGMGRFGVTYESKKVRGGFAISRAHSDTVLTTLTVEEALKARVGYGNSWVGVAGDKASGAIAAAQPNPAPEVTGKALRKALQSADAYAILDRIVPGSTWTAGGCAVLAVALQRLGLGGLAVLEGSSRSTPAQAPGPHQVQHWLVQGHGGFFDADGFSSHATLIRRWGREEGIVRATVRKPGPADYSHSTYDVVISAGGKIDELVDFLRERLPSV